MCDYVWECICWEVFDPGVEWEELRFVRGTKSEDEDAEEDADANADAGAEETVKFLEKKDFKTKNLIFYLCYFCQNRTHFTKISNNVFTNS